MTPPTMTREVDGWRKAVSHAKDARNSKCDVETWEDILRCVRDLVNGVGVQERLEIAQDGDGDNGNLICGVGMEETRERRVMWKGWRW
jgi:hypothetical protein